MPVITLRLAHIVRDPELQARVQADPSTVARYRELFAMGVKMPPPVVFETSPGAYILADGFQRVEGAEQDGRDELECEVRAGTREDAVLHAAGANSRHGLPMNNADKRRAVTLLLRTQRGRTWSDRAIAEHCGVSAPFVATVRRELGFGSDDIRTGADGRTINTRGLRRRAAGPTVSGSQFARTLAIVTLDDEHATSPRNTRPASSASRDASDVLEELDAMEARLRILLTDPRASESAALHQKFDAVLKTLRDGVEALRVFGETPPKKM